MADSRTSENCRFFVKRKKRFCRMTVRNGNNYCGEHLQVSVNNEKEESLHSKYNRISCPVDPTHTCYESKLAQHLKVCNARRLVDCQPSYIVKGINLGNINEEQPERVPLSQLDQKLIDSVIRKVETAYGQLPEIPEEILCDTVLESEIANESYGHGLRKHLLQNASLLSHLKKAGLTQDNTCFIEFGAGKGKLTYWLAQTILDKSGSSVLLIDRSSHRHKSDNKLKNEECPINVTRIRADIADLRLCNVPEIQNAENIVGIAKHLCGAATDLSIRCLAELLKEDRKNRISGLLIALCCHHRCEYASYTGKDYLEKSGFEKEEFPILCSIASWATCATGKSRNATGEENEEKKKLIKERENIGLKVKSLLNWGRTEYLRNLGFECNLIHYTTSDVSLENMCMVGVSKKL
ncbi:tRNA:m(4)X modification enzyme TRM13 homolog [Venturia canescens]|uniref:tRNA:m(4)X modification enzyme TRM13 homolog n=1 Tax=Venturia canescens TaxID=32260 RepID=UPI001C9BDC55|nr:tRNA:m(4)X modification enzyme TRM13 homolog [Venturia canescens]